MASLRKRPLFNPEGDIDVTQRRLIGGNTTNMNDFNNLKYTWTSDWYRQAMNNFWIPEEINLGQDVKDYRQLPEAERRAYDKILSFLVFLDSVQSANLPNVSAYITANEVDLCLTIQSFQECVHSQSYSYMLDTIASPDERQEIIFQWKDDEHLLARQALDCAVDRVDAQLNEVEVVAHRGFGVDLIPALAQRRVIDLQHEAGVGDGATLNPPASDLPRARAAARRWACYSRPAAPGSRDRPSMRM